MSTSSGLTRSEHLTLIRVERRRRKVREKDAARRARKAAERSAARAARKVAVAARWAAWMQAVDEGSATPSDRDEWLRAYDARL